MKALEPDEFRGLVLEELNSVYRLAFHLARSRDEAEDLVQETFLRALKSRSTFRTSEQGARPWLFKILHNTYKTRLERRQREPSATIEDVDGIPDRPAPPVIVPGTINWEQVDDRLKGAVDRLPATYRSVLLMWAVEGLKYREIALIIDAPVGTVMSRLHRARQAILERLGSNPFEMSPVEKDPLEKGPPRQPGRAVTGRTRMSSDEPLTARGDARPSGTGSA